MLGAPKKGCAKRAPQPQQRDKNYMRTRTFPVRARTGTNYPSGHSPTI